MRKLLGSLVAGGLIFAMTLPAMAQDKKVHLYGSARFETYIQDFDKESIGANFDDRDLIWRLDTSSSRFGARFKAGDIGGNVELRPNSASVMRHWYGTWNFGSGTALIGQTYAPSWIPICDECMIGGGGFMSGYGDLGSIVRQNQIQVSFPVNAVNGALTFAGLTPSSSTLPGHVENDTKIPRLEGKLTFATGAISATVATGYGSFDSVDATNGEFGIDSYFLTANVTGNFGPFWLSLAGGYGVNMADYGYGGSVLSANLLNNAVNDVDQMRFAGELGYKLSDKLSPFVNFAMLSEERDAAGGTKDEEEKSAFVIGVHIMVTRGVHLSPEIVVTDEGERTTAGVKGPDRGKRKYYGIYWQIDF